MKLTCKKYRYKLIFMTLLIFWLKIFFKKVAGFFKQPPIIFIWLGLLVFAVIIARPNMDIKPNSQILIIFAAILAVSSILASFKNYNLMHVLILYSKSSQTNKCITILYFIKQTIRNNLLLIISGSFIIYVLIRKNYFVETLQIITICSLSLFLSFSVMYLKYKFSGKKLLKPQKIKPRVNPYIKSTVFDYFTGDLILMSVVGLSLFVMLLIALLPNFQSINDFDNMQAVRIGLIIIFAFGFNGIIGSIPNINWRFYSIASPKSFLYFVKKTFLILTGCFFLLLTVLGIITFNFGHIELIKYLFFLFVMMLFSIFNAFAFGNIISTIVKIILFTALTAWISTLHIGFYLLLVILKSI